MKHAAMIAAKETSKYELTNFQIILILRYVEKKSANHTTVQFSITMNEAKEVHYMLRRAAGIFTFVQTDFLPQLTDPPSLASDLDARVLNAYINQCTAEAQEGCIDEALRFKELIQLHTTYM